MKKLYLVLLIFFILSACNTKNVTIPNFDFSLWKNDSFGCGDYRENKKDILQKNKQAILSLTEKEIVRFFGFPEKTELINRSEKFYFYYLSGNSTCIKNTGLENSYIRIRFNSLGYSKEILFLQEDV
ncbi:MAG: hypothetical protein ACJA2S_004767 [Cyclobacteriaceae bacterium]|jgi:hypothetical protein